MFTGIPTLCGATQRLRRSTNAALRSNGYICCSWHGVDLQQIIQLADLNIKLQTSTPPMCHQTTGQHCLLWRSLWTRKNPKRFQAQHNVALMRRQGFLVHTELLTSFSVNCTSVLAATFVPGGIKYASRSLWLLLKFSQLMGKMEE